MSESPSEPLEPCNGDDLIATVNGITALTRLTRCVVVLTLSLWLIAGVQFGLNGEVFLARSVDDWSCTALVENVTETLTADNCSVWSEASCQDVLHTPHNEKTVAAKFGLLCSKGRELRISQILFSVGLLIGGLAAGWLSDRAGRRTATLAGTVLLVVSGIWTALSPNYYSFAISRFLAGASSHLIILSSLVLGTELVPARHRSILNPAVNVAFVLGLCLLSLIGYLLRSNWQLLDIASWSLAVPLFFATWYLPESPHWLYSKRRNSQLARTVEKILIWPFKAGSGNSDTFQLVEFSGGADGQQRNTAVHHTDFVAGKKTQRWLIMRLLGKDLRWSVAFLFWIWLTSTSIYFGLLFTDNGIASDIYMDFFLISVAELPSGLLAILLNKRFGRKPILFGGQCATLIAAAVLTGIFWRYPDDTSQQTVKLVLAMVLKFLISIVMSTLFLIAPESFPTDVRALGMAVVSSASSAGAFLSPFLEEIGISNRGAVMTIKTVMLVISIALTTRLTETKDRNLTDEAQRQ